MFVSLFALFSWLIISTICSGQLLSQETLNTGTFCNISPFNLDCGNDAIVTETIHFAYRTGCDSTCCTYDVNDCLIPAGESDIAYIRRTCSGHNSCDLDIVGSREFCNFGTNEPSYVTVKYYCIHEARTLSICSSGTISSDGPPLYLSNENYPSVTTGDSTCSCSLEVYNCSSSINVFTIDVDLYYDSAYCNQSMKFRDGSNSTLKNVQCESYYESSIVVDTFNTHYMKIDFLDNSNEDQEGYFMFGFLASTTGESFSLSCSTEPETWCVECNTLYPISDGFIELEIEGNTNYGAKATITCNNGYERNIPEITCLANASWEIATCNAKHCGSVPPIEHGITTLLDPENSTFGSHAEVMCDTGYETNSAIIICKESGIWDDATCFPKDCGSVTPIQNGNANLVDAENSTLGAQAEVMCGTGFETNLAIITCKESGIWEEATCIPKDCGSVPSIQHCGFALRNEDNTSYGSTANLTCDPGYESETKEIICQSTGRWENASACVLEEDADNDESASKEASEGLSSTYIALIVCLPILFLAILVIVVVCYLKRPNGISPTNNAKSSTEVEKSELGRKNDEIETTESANNNSIKAPPVPRKHEIKHGHVYIDHGEAHIFGITIHLPHPFSHSEDKK